MQRETELQLIDELLAIKTQRSFYLDETVTRNPVGHYTDQTRFDRERQQLFRKFPLAIAHSSELNGSGAFLRRNVAGLQVLLTRDKTGKANAFLNACRHRGTRLVDDEAGCKHRFSCPYHAWTYANTGDLIAAPHFDQGFTGEEKSALGLARLECHERFGFIWVIADQTAKVDFDSVFGDLAMELDALKMDEMSVVHQDVEVRNANWKILVEGGIEAYHFKIAHRSTIGPHFEDNLSTYRMFGAHMRSILMRTSMANLALESRDSWRLRDHAQVLYTLFPSTALLVQPDHIAWVRQEPIAPDRTRIHLSTLVPSSEISNVDHWQRNHDITRTTLDEDFVIGESMQSTLSSDANSEMLFGRFEGALNAFNEVIEHHLSEQIAAE